jgi:hypothetical protein
MELKTKNKSKIQKKAIVLIHQNLFLPLSLFSSSKTLFNFLMFTNSKLFQLLLPNFPP